MIYINLLPVQDIKRLKKAKKEFFLTILAIIGICFSMFLTDFIQSNYISELQKNNERLLSEKQRYSKTISEITKIEEEKNLFMTRIKIVKQLEYSSSLSVHVLDEIANLAPPDKIWLTGLTQIENQLQLAGMALNEQIIAKYMDDLGKTKYIQNVCLTKTVLEISGDHNLNSFTISAQITMP